MKPFVSLQGKQRTWKKILALCGPLCMDNKYSPRLVHTLKPCCYVPIINAAAVLNLLGPLCGNIPFIGSSKINGFLLTNSSHVVFAYVYKWDTFPHLCVGDGSQYGQWTTVALTRPSGMFNHTVILFLIHQRQVDWLPKILSPLLKPPPCNEGDLCAPPIWLLCSFSGKIWVHLDFVNSHLELGSVSSLGSSGVI